MASSALSFDQSSSKRARRKRAPNVVECSTIDLTLDDDDLPSVSLTNLETGYNDDICPEAKRVGEEFGYEYGLAAVLESKSRKLYAVCPQQKVNILTMVIGQCVQDEHEMKLVDCFGKFMTVTLKATGGVDIQQDDIVGKSEKKVLKLDSEKAKF